MALFSIWLLIISLNRMFYIDNHFEQNGHSLLLRLAKKTHNSFIKSIYNDIIAIIFNDLLSLSHFGSIYLNIKFIGLYVWISLWEHLSDLWHISSDKKWIGPWFQSLVRHICYTFVTYSRYFQISRRKKMQHFRICHCNFQFTSKLGTRNFNWFQSGDVPWSKHNSYLETAHFISLVIQINKDLNSSQNV